MSVRPLVSLTKLRVKMILKKLKQAKSQKNPHSCREDSRKYLLVSIAAPTAEKLIAALTLYTMSGTVSSTYVLYALLYTNEVIVEISKQM